MSQTDNNKQRQKGKNSLPRILIISAIAVVIILGICLVVIPGFYKVRKLTLRLRCKNNLDSLGKAVSAYANDNNGKYPAANRWCDLLLEGGYVNEEQFKCPDNKKARCSYAMNKDIVELGLLAPKGMVLLFETKGGWNQVGGEELITHETHALKNDTHQARHIFYNDGHVTFECQHFGSELKWKAE